MPFALIVVEVVLNTAALLSVAALGVDRQEHILAWDFSIGTNIVPSFTINARFTSLLITSVALHIQLVAPGTKYKSLVAPGAGPSLHAQHQL